MEKPSKPRVKAWLHEARVTGPPPFPLDMLRFDHCHPADGEAVATIATNHAQEGIRISALLHKINLVPEPHWTPDRWASFGWLIESMSSRPV